jgi:hypothetical protein
MRADIVNGHLQIYPENEEEMLRLTRFIRLGLNEKVGHVIRTVRDGMKLENPELCFIQITLKGTLLGSREKPWRRLRQIFRWKAG